MMQALTKEMFIAGTLKKGDVKLKQLKSFCEEHGYNVSCATNRGITRILNDLVDIIEAEGFTETSNIGEATVENVVDAILEPIIEPEVRVRSNGEVIRLAADGKDYGANLLNRSHGK